MLGSWNTMPMDLRTSDGFFVTSKPLTIAVPEVTFRIVHNMDMVVLLPAPFGPSSPKISPLSTLKLMPSTAVKLPNFFVKFFVSMIWLMPRLSH